MAKSANQLLSAAVISLDYVLEGLGLEAAGNHVVGCNLERSESRRLVMVERLSMEETEAGAVCLSPEEVLSLLSRPVVIETGVGEKDKLSV
jgi:hypothetical protein